ncbi:MAG: hypothetical protein MJE68_26610 [Proteobacteria bacterium]|nr:hypothetical protein [Pseudomonadota bacterium]
MLQNNEQLQQKDEQIRQLTAELQQKDTELNNIQENFQVLVIQLYYYATTVYIAGNFTYPQNRKKGTP